MKEWAEKDSDWYKMDEEFKFYWRSPIDIERRTPLFSVFADLRNERKDGATGYIPIDSPRGWPKDLSDVLRQEKSDHFGEDLVSHSWLSVQEIVEYDWDKEVRAHVMPTYDSETDSMQGGGLMTTTAREQCKDFLSDVLPKILSYGKPSDLRLLFYFDNHG